MGGFSDFMGGAASSITPEDLDNFRRWLQTRSRPQAAGGDALPPGGGVLKGPGQSILPPGGGQGVENLLNPPPPPQANGAPLPLRSPSYPIFGNQGASAPAPGAPPPPQGLPTPVAPTTPAGYGGPRLSALGQAPQSTFQRDPRLGNIPPAPPQAAPPPPAPTRPGGQMASVMNSLMPGPRTNTKSQAKEKAPTAKQPTQIAQSDSLQAQVRRTENGWTVESGGKKATITEGDGERKVVGDLPKTDALKALNLWEQMRSRRKNMGLR